MTDRENIGTTGKGLYHILPRYEGGASRTGRVLRYNGDANNRLFSARSNLGQGPLPRL